MNDRPAAPPGPGAPDAGKDADSLERLVPDRLAGDLTGRESLRLHLERYAFAARHARPGRLLDLACGAGYGTRLLADRAEGVREAVGVDVAGDVIAYARQRYGCPGVAFTAADALAFDDADGFTTIVSLETIEHLADPDGFVERLEILLRPGGVLIASAPVTPSVDVNPHHRHDFTERSFCRLFQDRGFIERDRLVQRQPYSPVSVLRRTEPRLAGRRTGLAAWYLRHPVAAWTRATSLLRYGFTNRYLTVVWERRGAGREPRRS